METVSSKIKTGTIVASVKRVTPDGFAKADCKSAKCVNFFSSYEILPLIIAYAINILRLSISQSFQFQNPCKNGGSCEAMPSSFLCKCLPGFWGHFCEFPLDPCETAVCDNGGQCISTFDGHYECRCPPGFRGKNCDIRDVSCDDAICG